jgi:hypothetical protein
MSGSVPLFIFFLQGGSIGTLGQVHVEVHLGHEPAVEHLPRLLGVGELELCLRVSGVLAREG